MNAPRLASLSTLVGGIVWIGAVTVRLIGQYGLSSLDLILLLAVLVVAPLALVLVALPTRLDSQPLLYRLAVALQPPAALLVLGSLHLGAGPTAMLLSVPWFLFTLVIAAHGVVRLVSLWPLVEESAMNFGLVYLGVGGVWFLASRCAVPLAGFQEPLVTLTAIHFHFISLGALILTGMVGRSLARGTITWRLYRLAAAGMIVSPFLVALGITFALVIEAIATALISLSLAALAIITLRSIVPCTAARQSLLLAISSVSIIFTMIFATAYAFGRLTGAWEVTVPAMIQVHGWVNALGFVLPGLLAWALETPPGRVPAVGVPFSAFAGRGFIGPRFFDDAIHERPGKTPVGLVDDLAEYRRDDLPVDVLPPELRAFYEKTASHGLLVVPEWKPGFRLLSRLYKRISTRVGQMNLPLVPESDEGRIDSKIVPLDDAQDGRANVRAWIRTYESTGEAVYVAAYAAHRYGEHTYMNIAFPLPGGNLTSILRLHLLDDKRSRVGLALTSLRRVDAFGDEGVYFATRWLTVRLPINETISVWAANGDEAETRFSRPAPEHTTAVAQHEMWLFGKAFLTLYYFIYPIRL